MDRPLALALDEWTIRHYEPKAWPEPEPSADGGVVGREVPDVDQDGPLRLRVNRYSPRTLSDALLYAGVFHALHRTAGLDVPVRMANTINLVNANGVIVARPDGAVRASTYHIWDLYQNRMGTIAVATADVDEVLATNRIGDSDRIALRDRGEVDVAAGGYTFAPHSVTVLSVSL